MVRTAPGLPGKNKLVNWFVNSSVCQLLFSLIKFPPVIHYFGHYFSRLGPDNFSFFQSTFDLYQYSYVQVGIRGLRRKPISGI